MPKVAMGKLRSPRSLIALIVIISFAYVFLTMFTVDGGYSFILSLTVFCYFGFLVFLLLYFRNLSLFHPVFIYIVWREFVSGFVGDYFLLFSVNEIKTAVGVFYGYEAQEIIMKLFSMKIISLIAFLMGFYLLKNFFLVRYIKGLNSIKDLNYKLLVLVFIMIVIVFYLSSMLGGVNGLLNQRSIIYSERLSSIVGGHYHAVIRAIPVFLVLILCVNIKYLKKPMFVFSLILSYFCVFIVTGNRSVIITSVIMVFLVYILGGSKVNWKFLISISIMIIIVFGFLGKIRSSGNETNHSLSDSVTYTFNEMKARAVSVNGVIPILAKVPDEVDWLYGRSYLSIPYIFIPSALLSMDKPDAGGRITTKLIYKRDDTGIPPTPLGEAFWNFGIFGVFFIYLILGLIIRFFYNNLIVSPDSPINKFIYTYSILSLSLASDTLFNFFQFFIISIILYIFFTFRLRAYNK